jgi:hypothetical protein
LPARAVVGGGGSLLDRARARLLATSPPLDPRSRPHDARVRSLSPLLRIERARSSSQAQETRARPQTEQKGFQGNSETEQQPDPTAPVSHMALRQASRRLAARQMAGGLLAASGAQAAPAGAAAGATSSLPLLASLSLRAPGSSAALPLASAAVLHTSAQARDPAKPEPVPLAKLKDSFNDATSVTYLEELEQRYRRDPHSVDTTWASFFRSLGASFFFSLLSVSVFSAPLAAAVCSSPPAWPARFCARAPLRAGASERKDVRGGGPRRPPLRSSSCSSRSTAGAHLDDPPLPPAPPPPTTPNTNTHNTITNNRGRRPRRGHRRGL